LRSNRSDRPGVSLDDRRGDRHTLDLFVKYLAIFAAIYRALIHMSCTHSASTVTAGWKLLIEWKCVEKYHQVLGVNRVARRAGRPMPSSGSAEHLTPAEINKLIAAAKTSRRCRAPCELQTDRLNRGLFRARGLSV
jgi:hypothetical protein